MVIVILVILVILVIMVIMIIIMVIMISTFFSWHKSESSLSSPRCPQSRQTWSPNTTLTWNILWQTPPSPAPSYVGQASLYSSSSSEWYQHVIHETDRLYNLQEGSLQLGPGLVLVDTPGSKSVGDWYRVYLVDCLSQWHSILGFCIGICQCHRTNMKRTQQGNLMIWYDRNTILGSEGRGNVGISF